MRLSPTLLLLAALAAPAVAQDDPAARAYVEGRFVRALTALSLDDDSSAVRLLDEVLASAPGDPTVLVVRSQAALRLDDAAEAVYFARQAADAAPDDPAAWLALGTALRAADRPADALEALRRARERAPDDLDVLTALADLAAEQGDAALERDVLAALVRLGDTVGARLRLSALAEAAGDRADARAHARAAARLAPGDPAVARRLEELTDAPAGPAPEAAPASDGAALYAAGRFQAAADALVLELGQDPRRLDVWDLTLRAMAAAADPRGAGLAEDALLLFPRVPQLLVGAAEVYAALGQPDQSQDAARRATSLVQLYADEIENVDDLRARLAALLPD